MRMEQQKPYISILQKYEELFEDSLGKVKKCKASLQIKPAAIPTINVLQSKFRTKREHCVRTPKTVRARNN